MSSLSLQQSHTGSSLHVNLQAADFQSCARAPSAPGVRDPAAGPPSAIADHPSAPPPPTSPPRSVTLPACSQMPAPECRCADLLCFSRYCPVRLKMLYFFCCLSLCIIYVKSTANVLQYNTIYSQVCQLGAQANLVGFMNKSDLQMHSQNGMHSYARDLLYVQVKNHSQENPSVDTFLFPYISLFR